VTLSREHGFLWLIGSWMRGDPLSYWVHIWYEKTKMAGLQSREGRTMIDSVAWTQYIYETDTQTATSPQQMPRQRSASGDRSLSTPVYICRPRPLVSGWPYGWGSLSTLVQVRGGSVQKGGVFAVSSGFTNRTEDQLPAAAEMTYKVLSLYSSPHHPAAGQPWCVITDAVTTLPECMLPPSLLLWRADAQRWTVFAQTNSNAESLPPNFVFLSCYSSVVAMENKLSLSLSRY